LGVFPVVVVMGLRPQAVTTRPRRILRLKVKLVRKSIRMRRSLNIKIKIKFKIKMNLVIKKALVAAEAVRPLRSIPIRNNLKFRVNIKIKMKIKIPFRRPPGRIISPGTSKKLWIPPTLSLTKADSH